jgi:hypothetical protein
MFMYVSSYDLINVLIWILDYLKYKRRTISVRQTGIAQTVQCLATGRKVRGPISDMNGTFSLLGNRPDGLRTQTSLLFNEHQW